MHWYCYADGNVWRWSDDQPWHPVAQHSRDEAVGASYFTLSEAGVARTVPVSDQVLIDLDADGKPVGVEILGDL